MKYVFFTLFISLLFYNCSKGNTPIATNTDEQIYFPIIGSPSWETKTMASVGWNESELQPLLDFLEVKNTKSFIMLHNGKIVREDYFNNHSDTKIWYWASAGKTLTTAVSIAQEEGNININNKV